MGYGTGDMGLPATPAAEIDVIRRFNESRGVRPGVCSL